MLIGKQYRLERATLAVTQVDGKRKAITLPLGALLKVMTGPTNGDGMVTVLWDDQCLEMFEVDVNVRGTEIIEKGAGA